MTDRTHNGNHFLHTPRGYPAVASRLLCSAGVVFLVSDVQRLCHGGSRGREDGADQIFPTRTSDLIARRSSMAAYACAMPSRSVSKVEDAPGLDAICEDVIEQLGYSLLNEANRTGAGDARVLLLDTVSIRDASGATRTPSPMDSFIPACDTERIDALAAPTNRGG
jgi:hypothetical protein